MESEMITLNKDELYSLIRKAIRDELDSIEYVSDEEQKEIDDLYKDSLNTQNYNSKDCIRL
ncbi:MAG: hypothetical protein LAT82_06025 [Nanoarchaeota archaeon]|nr:hypothetical protein [Nanoarchaeota archaeon]